MKILFLAAAAAMVFLYGSALAQPDCGGVGTTRPPDPSGTEFLLCFMQNEEPNTGGVDGTYQDVYIGALDQKATVTISVNAYPTLMNFTDTVITLEPFQNRVYSFNQNKGQDQLLNHSLLIQSNEVVEDLCLKVTSTAPIVCYGMNHKQFTADAFIAYPRHTAGLEYMVMSYYNSGASNYRPSEFCVAAFDDNTTVTITPTVQTRAGTTAGVPFSRVLNANQAMQVQAADINGFDLTGSIVTADKQIVVYGGHVRAEVPVNFKFGGGTTNRDHLTEALPPLNTWGKQFILTNFKGGQNTLGDVVRVLASKNNTQVAIEGNITTAFTLQKGEYHDEPFNGPITIQSSEPILVGGLAHTININQGIGDPFFVIVPPVDQMYNDFTFFTSLDVNYTQNWLMVLTEAGGTTGGSGGMSRISINGNAIPTASFSPVGNMSGRNYFVAIQDMNNRLGVNRITSAVGSAAEGMIIVGYGFGPVDSYGYTAGAMLKPLRGIWQVHNPPVSAAPGSVPSSQASFRNIINEKVYLDKAAVTSLSNPKYSVKPKQNVMFDIGSLESGETANIDFVVEPPNTQEILTGELTVEHHTTKWRDMEPVRIPFTIYPQQTASVRGSGTTELLNVYPNPVKGNEVTVGLSLSTSGQVRMRLYDPSGRIAAQDVSQRLPEGYVQMTLSTKDLASGVYLLEVSAPGMSPERRQIIITR